MHHIKMEVDDWGASPASSEVSPESLKPAGSAGLQGVSLTSGKRTSGPESYFHCFYMGLTSLNSIDLFWIYSDVR